jgi:hypothetical protein
MSKRQYSIFDTIIARISQGSVPFDAVYWIDPNDARAVSASDAVDPRPKSAARVSRLAVQECATCD